MTKGQSTKLVAGTRVQDNKYGNGEGTVVGPSAAKGYWSVEFDNGKLLRFGYRMLDLI